MFRIQPEKTLCGAATSLKNSWKLVAKATYVERTEHISSVTTLRQSNPCLLFDFLLFSIFLRLFASPGFVFVRLLN